MLESPVACSWYPSWVEVVFVRGVRGCAECLMTTLLNTQPVGRVVIPYVNSCVVVDFDLSDPEFVVRVKIMRHVRSHVGGNMRGIEPEMQFAIRIGLVSRDDSDLFFSTSGCAGDVSEKVEVLVPCDCALRLKFLDSKDHWKK